MQMEHAMRVPHPPWSPSSRASSRKCEGRHGPAATQGFIPPFLLYQVLTVHWGSGGGEGTPPELSFLKPQAATVPGNTRSGSVFYWLRPKWRAKNNSLKETIQRELGGLVSSPGVSSCLLI
uniref:Uncharacterized protein n=1 Tax=Aegilops tauschii subsp. strangulata TaxID=200361 RepID=A0A453C990_AEGTS